MKNFLLVIIVFLSLISCGKKGDPEYKETEAEFMRRCMSDIDLISKLPSEERRLIECTSRYKNYD